MLSILCRFDVDLILAEYDILCGPEPLSSIQYWNCHLMSFDVQCSLGSLFSGLSDTQDIYDICILI